MNRTAHCYTENDEAFAYWQVLDQMLDDHHYDQDHPSRVLIQAFSQCIVDIMSHNLIRTGKANVHAARLIDESHVVAPELTEEMRFLAHVARSVTL